MDAKALAFRHFKLFNAIVGRNKYKKKGVVIENRGALLYRCRIQTTGRNNRVVLGKGTILKHCTISLFGDNNTVIFGEDCRGNFGDYYLEDSGNRLEVGNNTQFAGFVRLSVSEGTTVSIGSDCLFSGNIVFRTGDSHPIYDKTTKERINPAADIRVSDRVWIGYGATVLKGAAIPEDCVVATGAIVTKAFSAPGAILAGVPAKIVKENVSWNV